MADQHLNSSAKPINVSFDEAGRIDNERFACVGCGYILRGLLPGDACPECGESVKASLLAAQMGRFDPRYARWLWLGAGVMIGFVIIWFIAVGVGFMLEEQIGHRAWFGMVIPSAVLIVAVWQLSAGDASLPRDEQPRRARALARSLALTLPILWMVRGGIDHNPIGGVAIPMGVVHLSTLQVLPEIVMALCLCGLMGCLISVARRLQLRGHARWTRAGAWGFSAAGSLCVIGGVLFALGHLLQPQAVQQLAHQFYGVAPPPTRPAAPPDQVDQRYGGRHESWSLVQADGTTTTLLISADAGGQEFWFESVYMPPVNRIAYQSVFVDAAGSILVLDGSGPPSDLMFLQPQARTRALSSRNRNRLEQWANGMAKLTPYVSGAGWVTFALSLFLCMPLLIKLRLLLEPPEVADAEDNETTRCPRFDV